MKYALLFAATAAAYDAYGGYGAQSSSIPAQISSSVKASSSAPVYGGYGNQPVPSSKTSTPASETTPCSSSVGSSSVSATSVASTSVGKNGYTTVIPGYGKTPVTVTAQHQAYPTCVAKGYDGKSCDKWEDDKYVSTTITDCNKNVVTITKVQESVTVYQEKKTITHYGTPTIAAYGALSTGTSSKNATGTWYELYEKVHVVEYQNMGKNALVGYSGPGLCQKCDDVQEVVVKEYKGGKWSEEKKTFNYGKPQDEVKVYEKPGVYTVPAKVVTVYESSPTGKAPEASVHTYEAKVITITKPNQPYTCTYELPKQTPSKTPSKGEEYPAAVTKTPTYDNGNGYKASATPKTPENEYPSYPNLPVKSNTTSVAHSSAEKPTSTPCSSSSEHVYGENGYGAKSSPTPASSSKHVYVDNGYGAKSTLVVSSSSIPAYGNNGYGNNKPSSSVPSKASSTPCESSTATPAVSSSSVPAYGNNGYSAKSTLVVVYPSSVPAYGNNKPSSSAPAKASSTPCESSTATPAVSSSSVPAYGNNKPSSSAPAKASSTPCESSISTHAASSSSMPAYGASSSSVVVASSSIPAYGNNGYGNNKPSSSVPAKASSTPCESSTVTPAASSSSMPAYGNNKPSSSAPSKASSTPCESSSTPVATSSSMPAYGASSTLTPSAYGNTGYGNTKPSSTVPSQASSTPCDEDSKTPTPTPAKPVYGDSNKATPTPATPSKPVYENNNNGYGDNSKPTSTPVKAAYPADASAGYGSATEYGKTNTGYTKRGGMIERRKAVAAAQNSKRTIVL